MIGERSQIKELGLAFEEMNALLERILHLQFGIDDKEWLDAIQTIEDGYSKAVAYLKTKQT